MQTVPAIVFSALLGALFGLGSGNAQAPTPPAGILDDLCLVEYGKDLALRDRLVGTGAFYGDLGLAGIVRLDAARAAAIGSGGVGIAVIPELASGELLVATARNRAGIGAIHGRLLLARRAFYLSAARPSTLPADCRGSGFHGGLQVLDLTQPYATAAAPPPMHTSLVPDPVITAMVGQVQQSNLLTHVNALSAIFTRRSNAPENAQAIAYLTGQLATIPNITFTVETFSSSYGPNIIAELPGTDLANEIVMVGAHLDSIVGSSSTARSPGADDNASGSAAVLEMLRICSTQQFRRTMRFAWWNAEEFGLVGSDAYAVAAAGRGDQIVAYVNTDMNAYRAVNDPLSMDFVTNDSTVALINALTASAQTYVPGLTINAGPLSGGTSDHRSFFRAGFPAAFPFEDIGQYSPYIHTVNDTVGTSANDFQLSSLITQCVLAGLAELAEIGVANPGVFQVFGQGCSGTGSFPNVCASNNAGGGTLSGATRTNEYSYTVANTGTIQITSFDVYSATTAGGSVTVGAYLYADAGGTPAASPLATTTITIGSTPGFYTATFGTPVTVSGSFHLGVDHSAQNTYLATLTAGSPGSGHYRRPPLTGTWAASSIINFPAFRVQCGSISNAVPTIGHDSVALINRSFDVTLELAAPSSIAAAILGLSDQFWAAGTLPLPVPGAPGCELLVSTERIDSLAVDPNGRSRVTYGVPNSSALIGVDVFHQWIVLDAGANPFGTAFSAGARSRIGG